MEIVRNRDALRLGDQEDLPLPVKAPELFTNRPGKGVLREGRRDLKMSVETAHLSLLVVFFQYQDQKLNIDLE